jgi:hypothetical protein
VAYDASRVLVDDEVEVDGYKYPWYLCPFVWVDDVTGADGKLHDPPGLRELRRIYQEWKDWYTEPVEDWSSGKLIRYKRTECPTEEAKRRPLFLKLCSDSNAFFAHHGLFIVNKQKEAVLFNKWLYGQRVMQIAFNYQWFALEVAVRLIVLKARQFGGSTWAQATLFWLAIWNDNQSVLTMADNRDHTETMVEMVQVFLRNMPKVFREEELPAIANDTRTFLRFGDDRGEATKALGERRRKAAEKQTPTRRVVNSKYRTITAGGRSGERSTANSGLHGSEVGFWENAEMHWLAASQTVPLSNRRSVVVLESTANGCIGLFPRKWDDAGNVDSDYVRVFVPWFTIPDYKAKLTIPVEKFIESLTAEERVVQEKHRLTLEQMNWRRRCIKDQCNGDINQFRQEFPATPEEAFIVTGNSIYSPEATKHYLNMTRWAHENPVLWRGEFELQKDGTVAQYPREDGVVLIYKWPEPGKAYCIGLDPSEGRSNTADHSAIQLWSEDPLEQCAVLEEIRDPEFVCVQGRCLQILYNAFMVPEANAAGAVVIKHLIDLGAFPMYRREMADRNGIRDAYGYYAAGGTKKLAVTEAKAIYNNLRAIYHNLKTVREFEHLIHNGERYKSDTKEIGDDAHDATIICWMGISSQQFASAKRPIPEGMVSLSMLRKQADGFRLAGKRQDIPLGLRYDEDDEFIHPVLGAMG